MVSVCVQNLLLIVRGAPTQVADGFVGNLVQPKGEASRSHCRRAKSALLSRKRSSIKCKAFRATVSRFSPQLSSAPAGHLRLTLNRGAAQWALVHWAAATVAASSPTPWCSHCSDRMSRRLAAASFGRKHGVRQVSGSERCAETQGASCGLRRPSYNKSLQRSAQP